VQNVEDQELSARWSSAYNAKCQRIDRFIKYIYLKLYLYHSLRIHGMLWDCFTLLSLPARHSQFIFATLPIQMSTDITVSLAKLLLGFHLGLLHNFSLHFSVQIYNIFDLSYRTEEKYQQMYA
jgi:hypothetical protein